MNDHVCASGRLQCHDESTMKMETTSGFSHLILQVFLHLENDTFSLFSLFFMLLLTTISNEILRVRVSSSRLSHFGQITQVDRLNKDALTRDTWLTEESTISRKTILRNYRILRQRDYRYNNQRNRYSFVGRFSLFFMCVICDLDFFFSYQLLEQCKKLSECLSVCLWLRLRVPGTQTTRKHELLISLSFSGQKREEELLFFTSRYHSVKQLVFLFGNNLWM